jgi:biotin carboxyl carrier protein
MDNLIETGRQVVFLSRLTLIMDEITHTVEIEGTTVIINGHQHTISEQGNQIVVNGIPYTVKFEDDTVLVNGIPHLYRLDALPPQNSEKKESVKMGAEPVTAIMPGRILAIAVKEGDTVERGDVLCILEAMKMENEIRATTSGKIISILIEAGSLVKKDQVLMEIE